MLEQINYYKHFRYERSPETKLGKISGITLKNGRKGIEWLSKKAFTKSNGDSDKKAGNAKESGIMKQNGFQIVTRRKVIFNTLHRNWQLVASVGL